MQYVMIVLDYNIPTSTNNSFNINITLDINDLLPSNNTLYNYLNDNINWFIYKNPIKISKSCYSAIKPALERTVSGVNKITTSIFQNNDLNPIYNNSCTYY